MGQPGPSGDSDLATALHRLNLRRQNYLSEKQFFAEEWQRKIQVLANQKEGVSGCVTPTESLVSLCTNQSEITDLSSASCLRGFMPEKLQIVKPLEGNKSVSALTKPRDLLEVPFPGIEICVLILGALCTDDLFLALNLAVWVARLCSTLWKINE